MIKAEVYVQREINITSYLQTFPLPHLGLKGQFQFDCASTKYGTASIKTINTVKTTREFMSTRVSHKVCFLVPGPLQ